MAVQAQRGFIEVFPDTQADQAQTTLVVGDLSRWESEGRAIPALDRLKFIKINDLSADLVQETDPDIILSPLMADDFDAVDVAEKLVFLGFQGRYRAIAPRLPNAELILQEVRGLAPQLDFALLLLPEPVSPA